MTKGEFNTLCNNASETLDAYDYDGYRAIVKDLPAFALKIVERTVSRQGLAAQLVTAKALPY